MDANQLRIAALETAMLEVIGLLDPLVLADAARSLRVSARGAEGDEAAIQEAAVRLLEEGAQRWGHPSADG